MLKRLLFVLGLLIISGVAFFALGKSASAQFCPASNASCSSGQCCFPQRDIDPFLCTNQSSFNCKVVFNSAYWPPGSHSENCTDVNCETIRGTCSQADDQCLPDPVYGTCSWWNSGCTGSWCAACLKEGCCGPGGATPTPTSAPTSTPTPTPAPSCTVSLSPASVSVAAGATANLTANVVPSGGTVDRVNFASLNGGVATVNPALDASTPYQTVVTGIGVGSTSVTADVVMGGVVRCSAAAPVTVASPGAWWQVVDSDVTVVTGDIISPIPATCNLPLCEPVFDIDGPGGDPGVPMFSGNFDFSSGVGPGIVSSTGWLANARYVSLTQYTYPFFLRGVPGDAIRSIISTPTITPNYLKNQGAVSPDGYKWFFRTGDLTMQGEPTLGTDKVVLFVDGNLTIDGIIDLTKGSGFFMAIASGNITVNSGVRHPTGGEPELEGIFVTGGNFITAPDLEQLSVRGMVAAYGQVILGRDLSDNTQNPAELFTYAPDLLFNYPRSLTLKRTRWKEVTP